jgi:carboxyl-terminal processing protease
MPALRSRYVSFLLACSVLGPIAHAQSVTDLNAQASAAYQTHNYEQAISLFRRAEAVAPDDATRADISYNLACSQALGNHPDQAFATLDSLIQFGFTNRNQAEADSDFTVLQNDPRWPVVLTRMEASQKAQDLRWSTSAFKIPFTANLSDADKQAGLALLWAQARYSFANFWHVPTLDWNLAYRDYIPQVAATKSTAEYYRVLQRFYALLQDGHTGVWVPKELDEARAPLATALIDGHILILGSRDNGDIQGLRPGDEIVSINGTPAIAWATANVVPYITASSPQDLANRTYNMELLTGSPGTHFTLVIATPTGQQSTHIFTAAAYKYDPGAPFAFRMLPGNIAYVALNSFSDDTASKQWDIHWPEISKATSLVLDLRENPGGDDSVGAHILAQLLNAPVATPSAESTRWIATYRAWGQSQTPLAMPSEQLRPDPTHHFAGPVVLLTSARTYSAAEDIAVVFATAHRGRIVGEPTGGSSGQPLLFNLPGGGTARVCTKHDRFPDGREFIGIGVTPDIPAHNTAADIAEHRDRVLEAATQALRR